MSPGKTFQRLALLLILTLPTAERVSAQQVDALIDELVSNGTLSNEQADRIRARLNRDYSETAASKIALSNSVTKLQFYGDGRLRYENIGQQNHYKSVTLYNRERYRLRLGADYTFTDNFKAGFELESGTANDSANQTLGGLFTKASINVGKIYLRYDPTDFLTLYAGRFTDPWYTTTDMVYAYDLNPEGGAEVFNFQVSDNLQVAFNAVQYLYVDATDQDTLPNINQNDVQIIGNQVPVTWQVTKDLQFKIAPGFTFYTGGGNAQSVYGTSVPVTYGAGPAFVYGTANSVIDPVFSSPKEADDLAIFSLPGEINFKLGDIPVRPYWDFEMNLEGRKRIQDVYLDSTAGYTSAAAALARKRNQDLGDNVAWAAGVQVGQNKKKGDWSALGEFRQIGLGALDQNINGTDFADSFANQEGLKFSAAYNLADFVTVTATYYNTWDYKNGLYQSIGGPTGSTAPAAGGTQYLVSEKSMQRVQVDLGWKY